jgi:hypothetical protein
MIWSNESIKCVYSRLAPIGELRPHPKNPNQHSETQIAMLADLIMTVGWRFPIVVSKRCNYIIAGHARLQAAQRLNLEQVPVDYQDFQDEAQEMIQLLADNKIPELASRDADIEREVMAKLLADNASTVMMGYLPKELDALMKVKEKQEDLEHQTIPAMELMPHEHYDYIVLMFKHDYDWTHALQLLGIEDVNYSVVKTKKKIGLGRIIDGTRVLSRLLPPQGNLDPRALDHDHDAQAGAVGDDRVHGPGAAVV